MAQGRTGVIALRSNFRVHTMYAQRAAEKSKYRCTNYAKMAEEIIDVGREKMKQRQLFREASFRKLISEYAKLDETTLAEYKRIRELPFKLLHGSLQDGTISAQDCLLAFKWQALRAQQQTNCICLFIEEAECWAAELDREFAGKTKPPLFGLPFSVKEHIQVKGYDTTMGLTQRLNQPAKDDAVCVKLLKRAGAIPFVTTNTPQLLLAYSCANPIYGRTLHPDNPERTPGGSSGGEGALIALNGAPFGIGSDAAGSVRMPASFCGIVALKPMSRRTSLVGMTLPADAMRDLLGLNWGPMARDVATIEAVMRVVCADAHRFDPRSPPLPLDCGGEEGERLTIGYFEDDDFCQVAPAVLRGLRIAKDLLQGAGHKIVPWRLTQTGRLFGALVTSMLVDGGATVLEQTRLTVREPLMEAAYDSIENPKPIRSMEAIGSLAEAQVILYNTRQRVAEEWRALNLDCLLCPGFFMPATRHQFPTKVPLWTSTGIFNALDLPAGVVPVTRVTAEDVQDCKDYPLTDDFSRMIKEDAGAADTVRLPIAAQCAALPFREDLCLRLMAEVERLVNYH